MIYAIAMKSHWWFVCISPKHLATSPDDPYTWRSLGGGRHTSGTLRSVSQLPQLRAQRWRCELWANGQLPQAVRGSMQPGALQGWSPTDWGGFSVWIFGSEKIREGSSLFKKRNHDWQWSWIPMKCSLFWTPIRAGETLESSGCWEISLVSALNGFMSGLGWMGFPRMILWLPKRLPVQSEWEKDDNILYF